MSGSAARACAHDAPFAFSKENLSEAKKVIAKYPKGRQQSAVMPLLDLAQKQNGGWLSRAAMDAVAGMLEMPTIKVYEVATFYTMYNLQPMGEHFVQVCTTTPCWLRGGDDIMRACEKQLGVQSGETTADGKFTLKEVECLGACVNAPMMQINHHAADDANYIHYYEDLTPETAVEVLKKLANGEKPKPGPQSGRHSSEPQKPKKGV